VVCGNEHTLALTNKGVVYAWGDNFDGQVGVNNNSKPSGPTVVTHGLLIKDFLIIAMMSGTRNNKERYDRQVNVPEMGKVLDIAAYNNMSVAVSYDKIIFVWGIFYCKRITIPFPTKFSNIHDAFAYSLWRGMDKPLITNNFKYVEEVLNILESLGEIFDDPVCFIIIMYYHFFIM